MSEVEELLEVNGRLQRENKALRETNSALREMLNWPTLEIAQMSERIDFLFHLLAAVAKPSPVIEVSEQFPSLIDFISCEAS